MCVSSFTDCPEGYYGAGCNQSCHCSGSPCDNMTGQCHCLAGMKGQHCETGKDGRRHAKRACRVGPWGKRNLGRGRKGFKSINQK
jgi:hypothetical protein